MELIYKKYVTEKFDEAGRLIDITVKAGENFNFAYDVMDELAKKTPNKRALVWCNEADDEKFFTFKELKEQSNQAANFFGKIGLKKGDRVLMIMGRDWRYWVLMLACHKTGVIAIPCSNMLNVRDINYRVEKSGAKTLFINHDKFVGSQAAAAAEQIGIKVISPADFDAGVAKEPVSFARVETKASEDMLMYFTSGTTGKPKCAVHDYLYPLGHIVTAKHWQTVRADGLHLTVSDSGWAKCAWGKIYGQWLAETCIFVFDFDKFSASALTAKIKKYKITTFCAPPTIYRFFAKEGVNKEDFGSVKHATTAGESLNSEVFNLFKQKVGIEIKEGFGQTETTCIIGCYDNDEVVPGSMGRANPCYDIVLINQETGMEAEMGEPGVIAVRLAKSKVGIVDRYLDDDEANAASFHDGFYFTGDVARKDEKGNFYYVGRVDDCFKSSGYRISPFEIESVLIEHSAVRECAVIGVEDPEGIRGIVIKACVVLTEGARALRAAADAMDELRKELQAHVKANTAPYKYPRLLEFFEELPKTASGKIKRAELRKIK